MIQKENYQAQDYVRISELCFDGYNNYDERDSIVKAFRSIYRHISITDEPWEEDEKFYLPMLDMRNTTKRPFAVSTKPCFQGKWHNTLQL